MDDSQNDDILCVSFNQDKGCFVVGTESGFKIYNSYPYKDNFERSISLKRKKFIKNRNGWWHWNRRNALQM